MTENGVDATKGEHCTQEQPLVQTEPLAAQNAENANKKKKKKKVKKQLVPLPTLLQLADSLAFSVAFTQKLGRHAVAKRALKAGDLVLRELPVATVIRPEYQQDYCHTCLKALEGPQPVLEAGYYRFCSTGCLTASPERQGLAEIHSRVRSISQESDVDQNLVLFLLEIDALRPAKQTAPVDDVVAAAERLSLDGNGAAEGEVLVRCGKADVEVLGTHWEHKSPEWRQAVGAACKQLATHSSDGYKPSSVQTLQDLAAIIEVNSHGCGAGSRDNSDHALGLFPALSMFNHSCSPNAAFVATGREMQVRVLRDVRQDEQLCVAYINLTEDRQTRQHQLAHAKHFNCACERCSEPIETSNDRFLEGLACSTSTCPGPVIARDQQAAEADESDGKIQWACTACGRAEIESPSEGRRQLVEKLKQEWHLAMMVRREQGYLALKAETLFEHILAASPRSLHPLHAVVIDCLMPLVNIKRSKRDLQAAAQLLARLISAMDRIVGIPTPELGNLLDLQSQLLEERAAKAPSAMAGRLLKQARETALRAIQVRCITLGLQHPHIATMQARLRQLR